MRLDAKAMLEALDRPVFVDLDGIEYTGRLLSHLETSKFLGALQDWGKGGTPKADIEQQLRQLCEAAELPYDKIVALPEAVFQRVIADFFGFLVAQRFGKQAVETPAPAP